MEFTEKEYWTAARDYLRNGDMDKACCSYFKIHETNPDHAEAAFFSAYLGYTGLVEDNAGASAVNAFKAMLKCTKDAVKFVKNSEGSEKEKLMVLNVMAKVFTPIPRYVVTKFRVTKMIEPGVLGLYDLGSAIKKEFGSDAQIMKIVIEPWKEAVALQRYWYAYKYDGVNPEDYVAQIQKIDPAYTMPNKAGCISVAK